MRPLTLDLSPLAPAAHFKEAVQEKNNHNRPDCSGSINSVGDGSAVEYYFASDARWDTKYLRAYYLFDKDND